MGGKEKGDANDLSGLFIINYHYLNLKERERERVWQESYTRVVSDGSEE
jgi:hypothetical protein